MVKNDRIHPLKIDVAPAAWNGLKNATLAYP
jgi:hypothetical protein